MILLAGKQKDNLEEMRLQQEREDREFEERMQRKEEERQKRQKEAAAREEEELSRMRGEVHSTYICLFT